MLSRLSRILEDAPDEYESRAKLQILVNRFFSEEITSHRTVFLGSFLGLYCVAFGYPCSRKRKRPWRL